MTREEVAEWLEFLQEEEHNKADSIVPCTNEIALGIAIEALKQPQIVRCKDCKRYIEQAHECEALNQGCIKPDFFCGYGIRKDGDEDAD